MAPRIQGHENHPAQPTVVARDGRVFAAYPSVAIVFVFRDDERVLLLRHPDRAGWEPVNGTVEADETILQAAMREVSEELGADIRVRPLGVAHAWTFHYDDTIPGLIDVAWVMSFEGGEVIPGSDMAGSEWRWCALDEVQEMLISTPQGPDWLLERAVDVYRRYRSRPLNVDANSDGCAGAA